MVASEVSRGTLGVYLQRSLVVPADMVRACLPDARITLGENRVPHVYLVDNNRMLRDIGYELPPLRERVLDNINEASREAGFEPVEDAG